MTVHTRIFFLLFFLFVVFILCESGLLDPLIRWFLSTVTGTDDVMDMLGYILA